jgi:DNA-binding NtrC family response regulator
MAEKITGDVQANYQSPLTIIVAEKHPIARAALAYLLEDNGYRVLQAENLQAAMAQIYSVDSLAVLLADLDMEGWRSVVRHAMKTTGALIIGMEGRLPISDMYNLKERGIRICLKKPLVYDDIRAVIRNNLGLGRNILIPREENNEMTRSRHLANNVTEGTKCSDH